MPLIDNCQVPDALMDQAHDITAVGGKAFLCIPELPDGGIDGCRNCNATGQLHIQQAVGGPYDVATNGGKGTSSIWQGDKWYAVKTYVFECPVCNAASWRVRAGGR